MFNLSLEIVSRGVERPKMPTYNSSHTSRQRDCWSARCRTHEEAFKFYDLLRNFLYGKVVGYSPGEEIFLALNQPLTDEEALKIDLAIQEVPRKRFEGDDAPKTMEELLNY